MRVVNVVFIRSGNAFSAEVTRGYVTVRNVVFGASIRGGGKENGSPLRRNIFDNSPPGNFPDDSCSMGEVPLDDPRRRSKGTLEILALLDFGFPENGDRLRRSGYCWLDPSG